MRRVVLPVVVTLALLAPFPTPAQADTAEIRSAGGPTAIADSYIVVLKDAAVKRAGISGHARQLATAHGGRVGHVFTAALRGFEVELDAAAAKRLAADPSVAYVEQNHTVSLMDTQYRPESWGLDRIDQRNIPLSNSFTYPNVGADVHAYVIDTGIRTSHADFGGRASIGFDAVGGPPGDCNGHGTHVAGTVGGTRFGVAKRVQLVSVRVLGCAGTGSVAQVIAGIDWVTANAVKPAVANMSLGGSADATMDAAVANSIRSGVTYAIASGNAGQDACGFSPARVPAAITLGSTDTGDRRSSFSNVGGCVDLFAPGENITSDWMSSDTATAVLSGTSMATPHATGTAAQILSANPSWSPQQVHDWMIAQATIGVVGDAGPNSPNRLLFAGAPTPAVPPFQQFVWQSGSRIENTDSTWSFQFTRWDSDDKPDLVGIKRSRTGSGRTEVHILSGASGFQQFIFQSGTALGETDATWDYQLADWDNDGRPDLLGIKKSGTGSGRTEVHILSGASNFQQFILQTGTGLQQTDDSWDFAVADWDGDGRPDLAALVKSRTGSGSAEVHILSGASGFQDFIDHAATALPELGTNWDLTMADWDADGRPDLIGVAKNFTGTQRTEVHVLSGASNFRQFILQTGTALVQIPDDSWEFAFTDWDRDGRPELAGVAKNHTGTATTEVHLIKG